jgi:hypothetical protein
LLLGCVLVCGVDWDRHCVERTYDGIERIEEE